jgi:hypothetical protein
MKFIKNKNLIKKLLKSNESTKSNKSTKSNESIKSTKSNESTKSINKIFKSFKNKLNIYFYNFFKRNVLQKFNKSICNISICNKSVCNKNYKIYKKGQLCSINGNKYEKSIFEIVKNCKLINFEKNNENQNNQINNENNQINNFTFFNTQTENELGGSRSNNDLQCNFLNLYDIGIEAKIYNTPDWMQCSIIYDTFSNCWTISNSNNKIPFNCKSLFNDIILEKLNENNQINNQNNLNNKNNENFTGFFLFNNKIPPFVNNKITYEEWLSIKKLDNSWNDFYISIPNDTIKKLYSLKGCHYIQISKYGLYHLGTDICNFNVPEFNIEQRLRFRIKVHKKRNKYGFCHLSVIASCQPINFKNFDKSQYSLDCIEKLPLNLIYCK